MKIASVTAQVLTARPDKSIEFGIGTFDEFSCVLVEVKASDGTVGYGEAMTRRGAVMTRHAVEALLAPVLVGRSPFDIEGLWSLCVERLRRWGHSRGVAMEAISGVDIALWDLVGKLNERPIWQLLYGAGRREIPVYGSSVYIADNDVMCEEAVTQAKAGFRALKIKIGRPTDLGGWREDVKVVHSIRAAVGPSIDLMVDANGAYDAATAIRVARALEPADLSWFEEPVPPDDLEGYSRIRAMTSVPLATGETEFSIFGFRDLICGGRIDVAQPDTGRSGGITGARQAALLAYAYNRAFAPHTGFSAGISQIAAMHVAAASPVLTTFEYMFIDNPLRDLFVETFPAQEDSKIEVPTGPGLGLEIDPAKIARFSDSNAAAA